ncbi:hypothetical protein LTR84_008228 [Exophiala bonariae]|uniref:Uncharacterized protein n=1 Tax=Exophiala bonariae TaxID=1690606 RepID=A0AAV9N0B4_9EURO|nr:hypothetical protein LTR84_008228 [Exophiala bonariae]
MSFRQDPFHSLQRRRFSPLQSFSLPINPYLSPTEEARLLNTISTVDFYCQNVAKLDAAVHALVYDSKTVRDMGRILGTSIVVLNEQLGWFALNCFRLLRYLQYRPSEIFSYIVDEFQSFNPRGSHSIVRQQVTQTHGVLAQLAKGHPLSDIIYSGVLGPDITFSAVNLRMALYCTRVVECIQERGVARATFYHVMANAKMGIAFRQSFLQLGLSEPFYLTERSIENMKHNAFVPYGRWTPGFSCGSSTCSPGFHLNDVSIDNSEYSSKHTSNGILERSQSESKEQYLCQYQDQVLAIPAIKVQRKGAMVDAFDDPTRDSYEWKFLYEAQQSFYDQARVLQENGLLRL